MTTDAGLSIVTANGRGRVGMIDLRLPKLRSGSYYPSILRAARPENSANRFSASSCDGAV